MSYDLIILYSGGTDSRLMLKMALAEGKKPLCLFVDYGQRGGAKDNEVPWEDIWQSLNEWGVDYRYVGIQGLGIDFGKRYEGVAWDYVPNRNMIMLAIAASIAEQHGIPDVWIGANLSDVRNHYPDCDPRWLWGLSHLMRNVYIQYPLSKMTQEEVIAKHDDNANQ